MTIKGITRTCYGNVFNNDDEVHNMAHIYFKACLYYMLDKQIKVRSVHLVMG